MMREVTEAPMRRPVSVEFGGLLSATSDRIK